MASMLRAIARRASPETAGDLAAVQDWFSAECRRIVSDTCFRPRGKRAARPVDVPGLLEAEELSPVERCEEMSCGDDGSGQ
jgi:hypothetical protein